jgi:transketolase C-terminal domain/subunit
MVQPVPAEQLGRLLNEIETVICLEEHYSSSGLYRDVVQLKYDMCAPWTVVPMGLESKFIHEINDNAGMRRRFQIDSAALVERIGHFY